MKPQDSQFAERLEDLLTLIETQEGARLPGSRRSSAIREARANGIDVPVRYIDALRKLAEGGT